MGEARAEAGLEACQATLRVAEIGVNARMRQKRILFSAHFAFSLSFLALGLSTWVGCGDGKVARYPVIGSVNIDGKPADGAMVIFCPTDGSEEVMKLRPFGYTGPDANTKAKPGEATAAKSTDYQWADPGTYAVFGNSANVNCSLTTIMNCDNYQGLYSFHPGGAVQLYGDGSVDLLSEDVDPDTFISLYTRGAEDIAGSVR
jgi:hypothetical protein